MWNLSVDYITYYDGGYLCPRLIGNGTFRRSHTASLFSRMCVSVSGGGIVFLEASTVSDEDDSQKMPSDSGFEADVAAAAAAGSGSARVEDVLDENEIHLLWEFYVRSQGGTKNNLSSTGKLDWIFGVKRFRETSGLDLALVNQLWIYGVVCKFQAKGGSSLNQSGIQVEPPFRCVMRSWIE
ncbi:hypothetical protein DMENIID0001_050390 [Sergentomyia squamirostris]